MKKTFLLLALPVVLLASCQKQEIFEPAVDASQFTASVESFGPQTKTSMTSDKTVVWSENDRLAIFQGSTLADKFKVTAASAGKVNGTFDIESDNSDVNGSFSAGTELPCNIAFYPYSDGLSLTGLSLEGGASYKVGGVVIPATQNYVADSFGNGSFPMVAATASMGDHNLKFKNVFGALKLGLKGDQTVKSIKVTGKNNEVLSGTATVTVYSDGAAPVVTMNGTDAASKSVTLDCGAGVELDESEASYFVIALPPVEFGDGFIVTVTDSESNTYDLSTDKSNSVLRSSILIMPSVKLQSGSLVVSYIDEYGIDWGFGVEIDGVVWAPVNCGYKAATASDKGYPYGKLYQWGRKYGHGYKDETYEDMTCPDETQIVVGPVTASEGSSPANADKFFTVSDSPFDWCSPQDNTLWNSGTEEAPVKNTANDPCPNGWRVPTKTEFESLVTNYSELTEYNGCGGVWVSGSSPYSESVSRVFLSLAGYVGYYDGLGDSRESDAYYWCSSTDGIDSNAFSFDTYIGIDDNGLFSGVDSRAYAQSVRCVRE